MEEWNWDKIPDTTAFLLGSWREHLESARTCYKCRQVVQFLSFTQYELYKATCNLEATLNKDGELWIEGAGTTLTLVCIQIHFL